MAESGFGYIRQLHYVICIIYFVTSCTAASLSNVALNKPAFQSTYPPSYATPENVVDGNLATGIDYCTHTLQWPVGENDHWWRVDLQDFFQVHAVVITNRGDCCGYRLANFDVEVAQYLHDPTRSYQDPSARGLCLYRNQPIGQGATEQLQCTQPITGRYVTLILRSRTEPLHFCELQVLALPVSLVLRARTYKKHLNERAEGDLIGEEYVRTVSHCAAICLTEVGCTAVNIQHHTTNNTTTDGNRLQRLCQMMAFGGPNHPSGTQLSPGWNSYHLTTNTESFV